MATKKRRKKAHSKKRAHHKKRRGTAGKRRKEASRRKKRAAPSTVGGHRAVPDLGRPCLHCGKRHSASVHRSHGYGSFARTHGGSHHRSRATSLSKGIARRLLSR